MIQKTKLGLLSAAVLVLATFIFPPMASASVSLACQQFVKKGTDVPAEKQDDVVRCEAQTPKTCKGIDRTTTKGETHFSQCLTNGSLSTDNPIIKDLNTIINFLGALVVVVIIGSIIVGGIQYSLAGGGSDTTKQAKKRITDSIIALAIFLFTYAFLQWLIPGGVFQ